MYALPRHQTCVVQLRMPYMSWPLQPNHTGLKLACHNRIKASHICNGVLRNVLEHYLSCKFSQKLHRRMASMFHGIPGKQHLQLLHSHPG